MTQPLTPKNPQNPGGFEILAEVGIDIGLGLLFVGTVIDPLPGDEVAVGAVIAGRFAAKQGVKAIIKQGVKTGVKQGIKTGVAVGGAAGIANFTAAAKGRQEANGSTQAVFPFDPNDIIGPGGTGTDRWLTTDPILPYTIRFENVATATAPAVLVNITHTLDSDLDLNTFELGDFGFGSTTIIVPDGLQNYTTRLDLRDTIGDFVDFTATLDTATRLVTWKIITIDPLTGEPAEGVTDGFLPPNNANGDGDGFVNYRIKAKGDTPNGASIDAQASIVFDTNAPIVTPVWSNKIDTNAPTSKVQTLTATTAGQNINVTWAGTDDGSGVGKYDVYVAVDSGAYTLWQNQTDKTSGTYTGEIGKTYSFYSIATDGVGRTETKTATAETTTKLVELPTVPPVPPIPPIPPVPPVPPVPTIPTITIAATDADAAETLTGQPPNPGQFTLTRTGATIAALAVNYTLAGTATNGKDYPTLGIATFAAGSTTTSIDINPIDDKIYEGTETVILSLTANPAYIIPAAPSAIVNITDNDAQTPQLTQPQPNLLSIAGGTSKSLLKLTKTAQEGVGKNEAFAFVVDDDLGRIGGIAPGTAGYLNAALDRSQVIFSNLGNNPIDNGFDLNSQRYLNITPGDRIQFGLVADDSIDTVKAALAAGKSTPKVLFSLPGANANNSSQTNFTALPNNGGYQIAWTNAIDDGKTNRAFNDMVLKVETIDNFTPAIGTNLQTKPEGAVLDLRNFAGQTLKIDTVSVSDAAYNNYIGFYAVEDTLGTLANGLKVGDAGYAEAAIKSVVLRSSKTETLSNRSITGGKIFAPVMVANGTFEDFLNRNPQNQANSNIHAYFNYLGANPDRVDHFRLLGDNKFGVEDLYGGGDKDYNDIVFQVNVKS
ncbi:DUF4114 domain-containing protein [Chamaesiphon sp.]|uniref:DUF4114 domain-containing protein n=1 Tax=Chamaesiphon sp. TaxID=2814140 RepID=UPI003594127C